MPAMLETVGSSISGSTRHKPLLESPYHMWRTGLPVNWLMGVPFKTTPELGAVTDERPKTDQSCVPAHSFVVVGVFNTVTFCAFAETANAKRTARHQSASCRGTGRSRTARRPNVVAFELLITKVFLLSGRLYRRADLGDSPEERAESSIGPCLTLTPWA